MLSQFVTLWAIGAESSVLELAGSCWTYITGPGDLGVPIGLAKGIYLPFSKAWTKSFFASQLPFNRARLLYMRGN